VGELLARIRAILRRSQAGMPAATTVGPLRVEASSRRAWVGAEELALTSTEFDLLELLSGAAGTIVSRDTIARNLHGRDTTAYERAIDVHISHLRRKLAPAADLRIKTIRGTGYVLVRNG
jgi:DNA-binding response OmpR family regulator